MPLTSTSQAPRRRRPRTGGSVVVALILLAMLWVAPAAAVPPVSCGKVAVKRKHYLVTAHVLSCRLAKKWAINYLAKHRTQRGYECQTFDPQFTKVRFVCNNPATASRTDGPQSYSAST